MSGAEDSGKKIEKVPLETDQGILESEEKKWGLPLKQVYKQGLAFFKDHDGKALQLTYADRLQLVAYTQQAVHGPLATCSAAPLGVLDMIGRDRRAAWQSLGDMSHVQAMAGFVHSLDRNCDLFRPFVEAARKKHEAEQQKELQKAEEERARSALEQRVAMESQKEPNEEFDGSVMQKVKEALNAQTYEQFCSYAAQQYPGNCDQQALLVRQLQDQHLQQYLQQVAVDQKLAHSHIANADPAAVAQEFDKLSLTGAPDVTTDEEGDSRAIQTLDKSEEQLEDRDEESDDGDVEDYLPAIEEARMWTKPEINKFKEAARTGDGKLLVAHGETVTLRVPTHAKASCLCWEFATDSYDIGFGLYFEWTKPSNTDVTVCVTESDDDDDDYNDGDEEYVAGADPELGPGEGAALARSQKPPVSIVVPVYRRDSHTDIYVGTHKYPGEGVYLMKFDNTYSLWRSKTVYYKIHHYYSTE